MEPSFAELTAWIKASLPREWELSVRLTASRRMEVKIVRDVFAEFVSRDRARLTLTGMIVEAVNEARNEAGLSPVAGPVGSGPREPPLPYRRGRATSY